MQDKIHTTMKLRSIFDLSSANVFIKRANIYQGQGNVIINHSSKRNGQRKRQKGKLRKLKT